MFLSCEAVGQWLVGCYDNAISLMFVIHTLSRPHSIDLHHRLKTHPAFCELHHPTYFLKPALEYYSGLSSREEKEEEEEEGPLISLTVQI